MFFAGMARHTIYLASDLASDMTTLLWMSLGPLVLRGAFELTTSQTSYKMVDDNSRTARIVSTVAAVVLIPVFGSWLLYKRTHRDNWASAFGFIDIENEIFLDSPLERVGVTTLTQLTHCAITAGGVVAMVFVARFVVASIAALAVTSSISVEFFGFIIHPVAIGFSNFVKVADFAYHRRPFHCLFLTFGAAIGSITVTFPLLLFISWGLDVYQFLKLPTLHLVPLVLGVWLVSYLVRLQQIHYLSGLICISL